MLIVTSQEFFLKKLGTLPGIVWNQANLARIYMYSYVCGNEIFCIKLVLERFGNWNI